MAEIEIIELFSPAKPVELNGAIDNDPPVQEAISIHVLPKARVNYYGYVFFKGKAYEHFISPRHRGSVSLKSVFANYIKKKKIRVDYPVISVAHGWYDNYYHFTLEVLIKIFLLSEHYPEAKILFPSKMSGFHRSWFALLDIKNLQFIDEDEVIISPKVISCNFPNRDLNHHDQVTPLFRSWILSRIKNKGLLDKPLFGKNIFIDREKASYRKILNHEELLSLLKMTDFEVLNFEDLELHEQINAMYFAKKAHLVHGAGLTNMLFCEPGTAVLDVCHKNFNQWCFYKLAVLLKLNYQRIPCEGNQAHKLPGYCDLYVNLDQLKKLL